MLGHDDELGYMSQKNLSAYILKIFVTYRHRTKTKAISFRRLTNNGDDFLLCNHQGNRNKNAKKAQVILRINQNLNRLFVKYLLNL